MSFPIPLAPARRPRACRSFRAGRGGARGAAAEAAGAAHAAHLAARLGRPLTVLTERGNTGRAPDFTLVRFRRETAPGEILPSSAQAADGRALIAA